MSENEIYRCDLNTFGECPFACRDCANCKPVDYPELSIQDDEPEWIDDDCGFDPYEGCYTFDC